MYSYRLRVKVLHSFGNWYYQMSATSKQTIGRRSAAGNIWLSHDVAELAYLAKLPVHDIRYEVQQSEEAVGRAMFDEIVEAAAANDGPVVIVILGGRGGQALHRLLGELAKTS